MNIRTPSPETLKYRRNKRRMAIGLTVFLSFLALMALAIMGGIVIAHFIAKAW